MVECSLQEVPRDPFACFPEEAPVPTPARVSLNPDQAAALDRILQALDRPEPAGFLLEGDGKRENRDLSPGNRRGAEKGKNAFYLVPEIALTPQTVARVRARFGETVAVFHSGLGQGERFDEWWRVKRGEARVVVGARSALFVPLANPGLIILDEEHEYTYKQEETPVTTPVMWPARSASG